MEHLKLALEGGKPVRNELLSYGRQSINEEDIQLVTHVLRGEFITRGPAVEAFERAIADYVEMPYAVAFNSATSALHAAMALVGVKENSRVITTPNTFAATSNAVLYQNGRPEFQDVRSDTLNLDAKALTHLEGVTAVVPVDFAGNPCDYDDLRALQKRYGFKIIADASHSLGAFYHNKKVGSLADLTIFSFHPVKPITTAEGGMIVCRDKEEFEFLQKFRSHGLVRTSKPGFYKIELLGYNYNITDLQCALGLSQLKRLPDFNRRRGGVAEFYNEAFSKNEFLEIPKVTEGAISSWHLYPIRLHLEKLIQNRDEFLRALIAENIGANVHYIPVHWHPLYQSLGYKRELCPVYEKEYLREISLPLHQAMTESDAKDVVRAVDKVLTAFKRS